MTWPLFRGRRNTLETWIGKIIKRIGTRPSALHSTFHFWRKSRRIASFLMLSTSKIDEVLQNCFVFDVVKFENWGSLAELLRFLTLSSSRIEEVSQNSFVFKLADRLIDRLIARYGDRQLQLQLWLQPHYHYSCKCKCKYATLQYANYTTLTTYTTLH